MPCTDGGIPYPDSRDETIRELERRNDELAQLLCRTCSYLEDNKDNYIISEIEGLERWWIKHKKFDEQKKKKLIANALKKAKAVLNTEELEIIKNAIG